jgi:hypothetical protein
MTDVLRRHLLARNLVRSDRRQTDRRIRRGAAPNAASPSGLPSRCRCWWRT